MTSNPGCADVAGTARSPDVECIAGLAFIDVRCLCVAPGFGECITFNRPSSELHSNLAAPLFQWVL